VFDLEAGPVTISLPDAGNRYMSMQVIDQDHFSQAVVYGAGSYSFSREKLYTRYIFVLVRTLVDPTNRNDVEQVHALQDATKASQSSPGRFEVPNWDQASRKKVHDALLTLGETISSFSSSRSYGTKDQVDPVRHLIRTARGWGGLPERDAFYLGVMPAKNDGITTHRLNVKDAPVDGFWSVSVYNAEGYFEPNQFNAYSLNNITATKSADGSVMIQFGSCDGSRIDGTRSRLRPSASRSARSCPSRPSRSASPTPAPAAPTTAITTSGTPTANGITSAELPSSCQAPGKANKSGPE
jgi:hypothetical protein